MDEFLIEIYAEVFKKWILMQKKDNIQISLSDDNNIILIKTKYSESEIHFYEMNIIEFSVKNLDKNELEFYLHFQIKNIKHVVDLFNEMFETIYKLTSKPTLKVLLTCTGGLTTGYFADRINEVALLLDMDIHVDAVNYMNLYKVGEEYDMIMLAPQISYMYAKTCGILKDKNVVKIPPAVFAKYDVKKVLAIIEEERNFKKISLDQTHIPLKAKRLRHTGVKTLSLALIRNSNRIHIVYRLYDEDNEILENNEIIKPTLSIQDYYAVIDSLLAKYPDIAVIGLCSPGIIHDGYLNSMGIAGIEEIDFERDFTSRYTQKFIFNNDANTIALGYYSSQDDCSSLAFVFQPVASFSGAGYIINDQLIIGHQHLAGEVQYLPLSYSKNVLELHQTPDGALEAMAKTIVSIISFMDPQIIVVCCFMLTSIDELRKETAKYIPKQYIPKIVFIDYLQEYMLLGTLLLCHQNQS
ncbi:MAG: ROK family protein [Coprobacillus sp.]